MKGRRIFFKYVSLILGLAVFYMAVVHVNAGDLSDAQEVRRGLESQLQEAQELIARLRESQGSVEENIAQLNQRLSEIDAQIVTLEQQLAEKETEISDTRQELAQAQADAARQSKEMKTRIRFMYENGGKSYLEFLLESDGIADFLNRAEYIAEITSYDRRMLEKYKATVYQVEHLGDTLEQERTELAAMREEVQDQQEAVGALITEKQVQLSQIGGELSDAQKLAQDYENEILAQNEIIAEIQKAEEARRQEEARRAEEEARRAEEERNRQEEEGNQEEGEENQEQGGSSQEEEGNQNPEPTFGGVFQWPCPASSRITSDYGEREDPMGGANVTFHKGIDIGAPSGSDIVAAADGTVVISRYSNTAGNYISINHGNGVYSVYMHCSSLLVGVGEYVTAGQVIAKVGSTGNSTGPHLHFGVTENGSYVNPWNYLK